MAKPRVLVFIDWYAPGYKAGGPVRSLVNLVDHLRDRIDFGRQMPWWGHQADYAWVNLPDDDEPSLPPEDFRRTTHVLMDARLMMAYARSLAEHGRIDHARYVAQRLSEFRNARAQSWFRLCDAAREEQSSPPFQCEAPQGQYTWRDMEP